MKALVQVTEEEKHILPGGDSTVIRVTSNPDVNGRLQPVQREIVETKRLGTDTEETNVTVMLPSVYGGLAPAFKTRELRKRAANDTVKSQKTTLLSNVNGKWEVSELRQKTATQDADQRMTEELVSRRDAEGRLMEVSRVVTREAETAPEEKREIMEMYSVDVPAVTRDSEARQNLPARVRRADWELVAGSAGREGSVGYLLDPQQSPLPCKK